MFIDIAQSILGFGRFHGLQLGHLAPNGAGVPITCRLYKHFAALRLLTLAAV